MMTHGKIPFSGFSNWKFLKRSSLGLTTCHVNIILVKKVFFTFLILPQRHLHYPYMPLGPKENLSHHGKIVPCDKFENCFANFFFMVSFCFFFMILSYGEIKLFMILFCFVGLLALDPTFGSFTLLESISH